MKVKLYTGILMTLFLVATLFTAAPAKSSPGWDGEIHIAVVGPTGWVQMEGLWVGAVIAAERINLGPNGVDNGGDGDDGIVVNGTLNYKVVLTPVDEHAADVGGPNPTLGWNELLVALEPPFSADFVVGGFRTECVGPMVTNFKTYAKNKYDTTGYAPIWFICGAATNELIDCAGTGACGGKCIRHNYDLARFVFRNTPMNGTYLFMQLGFGILRNYILPTRLYPLYQAPVKTYVLCEGLTWTLSMMYALCGSTWFPYPGVPPSPPSPYSILGTKAQVVGYAYTDPLNPDWNTIYNNIIASNARLIIHIYSAVTGVGAVTNWRDKNVNAALVGINVESQRQEFWTTTTGKCEYETGLATLGTATNINPTATPLSTKALWWEYYYRSSAILTAFYGTPKPASYPVYTMWGVYGVLMEMNDVIEGIGYWPIPSNRLIPGFEMFDSGNAPTGNFKYTSNNPALGPGNYTGFAVNPTFKGTLHDLYCDTEVYGPTWPHKYSRSLIVQWQLNATIQGEQVVIWPQDQLYSRRYRTPSWMYMGTKPGGGAVSLAWTDCWGPAGVPDGVVDVDDAQLPALAFGGYPGNPKWNIEADLTADGVIDVDDSQIPALAFGNYANVWPLPM